MLDPSTSRSPSGGGPTIYRWRPDFTVKSLDAEGAGDQYVVRFHNGKHLQLTEKLHDVLAETDGKSNCQEIADRLADKWQVPVSSTDVEGVVHSFLRPYGLVAGPDDAEPAPDFRQKTWREKWRDKLLLQDFFFRFKLVPKDYVAAVAHYTAIFLTAPVALAVLPAFVVTNWSAYRDVSVLREAGSLGITQPTDYLLLILLVFASVVFHEIGHASAVTRFGGKPDDIGCGLYFIYPALYANVNESWKFTRGQRVIVDLAGIYFQMIAVMAFYATYLYTGKLYLLYALFLSQALAIYSLVPFFKFDGYWCLADAVGVPNLRQRSFQLFGYRLKQLIKRVSPELPGYLRLKRPIELTLITYAVSSLVFFAFVVWTLAHYAPPLFLEYPGYLKRSIIFLLNNISSGLFSQAAIILLRVLFRTFILLGLSLVLLSLGISLHQTMKRLTQRRT